MEESEFEAVERRGKLFKFIVTIIKFILVLLLILICIGAETAVTISENYRFMSVSRLLEDYGYPNEVHTVQTPDGYLLEVHRLKREGGKPVLLVHGLLLSSAGFLISGPKNALAYVLYDHGYDVWLANTRGNKYSRKHTNLNPENSAFWDFSFHELGIYDVPAMVDYVISKTGVDKIHYIGHSQGSTAFFVMCDQKPGYCDKIRSVNALAPAVYLNHMRCPLIKAVSKFIKTFQILSKIFGITEVLPNNEILEMAGQVLCKKEATEQSLCKNIGFLSLGYNSEQLNMTMIPIIHSHFPAGASVKQLLHFGQLVKSGSFQMYDYGRIKNLITYGKLSPPNYDLKKTTAPVAVHYSQNDRLVGIEDAVRLSNELPNLIGKYLVPIPTFNHINFVFGIDSKTAVYDEVIKIMKSMEN